MYVVQINASYKRIYRENFMIYTLRQVIFSNNRVTLPAVLTTDCNVKFQSRVFCRTVYIYFKVKFLEDDAIQIMYINSLSQGQ